VTEATYKAWDGNLYEWPPPQGWYEASDGQWWPEGYGPRLEAEIDTGDDSAAEVAAESVVADSAAEAAVVETVAPDRLLGEATGFDTTSLTAHADDSAAGVPTHADPSSTSDFFAESGSATGSSWARPDSGSRDEFASSQAWPDNGTVDADESAAAAAAAVTGDHKPMTAWVAESAETSVAGVGTEPSAESVSTPDDHPGTSEVAAAGLAATGAAAGLTELAGTTQETGSELFLRLQAEAEARRGDITEQVEAGADTLTDAGTEAVAATTVDSPSGAVSDVLSDAAPDTASTADSVEFDGEPTIKQPVIDTTSGSEFSGRFGNSRPGFANSAYDEPAYDEPGYDEPGYDEPGNDEPGYDEQPYEGAAADSVAAAGLTADEIAPAGLDHDVQAYTAQGQVETQPGDTRSYDSPSFSPGRPSSAYDDSGYDPQAPTDPGFGADYQGGDYQAPPQQPGPGQSPVQAASLGYESPRVAASPMDAPTPSAGLGRRILYTILGVLALAAAGVAGYLAFQLQNDSDDGPDGTEQTAGEGNAQAVVGSLANPHDPGSGIRVEYPDGAETQPWTLQLQSVESDGAGGEARLVLQIVNDEAQGEGELADLQLALVNADGNDLASTPSPCGAGDSLDLAATLGAGQGVSGPVCWSVGGALPDNALLAVQSTKAQGRIYISLP
jgi:hypothetical protein